MKSIVEYYKNLDEHLYFHPHKDLEKSNDKSIIFNMIPKYGKGNIKIINFYEQFLIINAKFTPKVNFEKISKIKEEYIEISQFETNASSYKIEKKKLQQVDQGIRCYRNTFKTVYAFCEEGKETAFTKIIVTRKYFDKFLGVKYNISYENFSNAVYFLSENPNLPELNLIFQHIRKYSLEENVHYLYLESKIMEFISLILFHLEKNENNKYTFIKLDKQDKNYLDKTIDFMKKNLAAYPSIGDLAQISNMSVSRFQMAFRQTYGTTPYEYLKTLRMNQALLLLKDSSYNIQTTAIRLGYKNAGHFSKLFKNIFGVRPLEYRNLLKIK